MRSVICLCLVLQCALFSNEVALYEDIQDEAQLSILNPSLSERKTAKIRLKNGLEAYLVSDPGIEQSSAGLSVEAGSWNDPKEYPGMAHFFGTYALHGNQSLS